MSEEKLIWGAGFIDDDLVCDAIDYKPRRIRLAPWACAAAAAVVLATAVAVLARQVGSSPVLPPGPAGSGYSTGTPDVSNSTSSTSEFPASSAFQTESSSATNNSPEYTSSTDSTVTTVSTGSIDEPVTPVTPIGDQKAYAAIFEEFYPENPTTYGPPLTCEEIMNMMKPNPDYPEYDVDSYYLVYVVQVLPKEIYTQMRGESTSGDGDTLYEVKLVEDLISGEKLDRTAYVEISGGLDASIQLKGDPTYAPGEQFTAALSKPCKDWNDIFSSGYDLMMSIHGSCLRYDLPQMSFTDNDEETMLYFRGRGQARTPIADLPFETEEINIEAAYSTPQNPATYIQKIALDDLVEFFRSEWDQRGISSHFETHPLTPIVD